MNRPMAPDEALYECGMELDETKARLAKAEALLREAAEHEYLMCTDVRTRALAFLEGK